MLELYMFALKFLYTEEIKTKKKIKISDTKLYENGAVRIKWFS